MSDPSSPPGTPPDLTEIARTLEGAIADGRLAFTGSTLPAAGGGALLQLLGEQRLDFGSATVTVKPDSVSLTGDVSLFGLEQTSATLTFARQDGDLVLSADLSLPDWSFAGVDWLRLTDARVALDYAVRAGRFGGSVGGTVRAGSFELPVSTTLPNGSVGWALTADVSRVPVPSLSDLGALVGLGGLDIPLPGPIAGAGGFALSDFSLTLAGRRVAGISATVSLTDEWPIIPSKLSLRGVRAEVGVRYPGDPGPLREIWFRVAGTITIGSTAVPVALEKRGSQWSLGLLAGSAIRLPRLADVLTVAGAESLADALPEGVTDFQGIKLTDLGITADLAKPAVTSASFGIEVDTPWSPGGAGLEVRGFALNLTADGLGSANRVITGAVSGSVEVAGTSVDLLGTIEPSPTLTGRVDEIRLTELAQKYLPGAKLPAELPDVTLSNLEVSVTPKTGALSFRGTGRTEWDLGDAGTLTAQLDVTLDRPGGGGGATCAVALTAAGPARITDDVVFQNFALAFAYDGKQDWSLEGTVGAALFGRDFTLQASYAAAGGVKRATLAATVSPSVTVIDLGGIGGLSLSAIGVEMSAAARGTASAATGGSALTLSATGRFVIDGALDLAGEVAAFKQADGKVGVGFTPTDATVRLPLPIPGSEAAVTLALGRISIVTGGTNGGAAFEAAADLAFTGLPPKVAGILPASMSATLRADTREARITVSRLTQPLSWSLPDLEVAGGKTALGTIAVDLSNLRLTLGQDVSFGCDLGLGLPAGLNKVFGVDDAGNPKLDFFRTYAPGKPDTLVRTALAAGGGGLSLSLRSSPLKAIETVQDQGKTWFDCRLGDFGRIRIQAPVFSYDPASSAFEASGGAEVVEPLSIPLTPIKLLLEACKLGDAARLLPDALPIVDVELVDQNGKLRVDEFVKLLEGAGTVPQEVKDALAGVENVVDRLPRTFTEYLNIRIPKSLFFDISMRPDGSVSFGLATYTWDRTNPASRAAAKAAAKPIRVIYPGVVQGLIPMPGFNGIQLRRVSFGPTAGGSLFQLEIDAIFDQFDIATLAASLLLPTGEKFPLPTSDQLQRRIVLDDLFMIIVYQTGIPVPVPIFYDELALQYLGIEGVDLQGHVSFPMPAVSAAGVARLLMDLKQFFTDRDYLLDPKTPPGGINLVFTLDNDYLQLPEYLGGKVLGLKASPIRIDVWENVANLLNGLKTISLNSLIQAIPLEHRVGSASAGLAFLSGECDWLITTPHEFYAGAYRRLNLTEATVKSFATVLPTVAGAQVGTRSDDQGLILFLRGAFEVKNVVGLDAAFGLAASGPTGFATGFRLAGTVATIMDMELSGSIAIGAPVVSPAPSPAPAPSPSPAALLPGPSLSLAGGRATVPNRPPLQITGSQTIELWVKPQALGRRQNPVYKSYGAEGAITIESDGRASYYYGTAGRDAQPYQGFTTTARLAPGEWTHLAMVRDLGAKTLTWYINGELVAEGTARFPAAAPSGAALVVGAGYAGPFRGDIAEVRLWNRARTAAEIADQMTRRLAGNEAGLAGYWPCDDGSGTALHDRSLSRIDGAVAQGATFASPSGGAAPPAPATRAVIQLQGHSHLVIAGRPIFVGDIRLVDDDLWFRGMLDLFPEGFPLSAKGACEGSLSPKRLYLAGAVETRLAGVKLVGARAIVSHERIYLEGYWLGVTTVLDLYRDGTALALRGSISVDLSVSVRFGEIQKAGIKLSDGWSLSAAVTAGIGIGLSQRGFSGTVRAGFTLNGKALTVGPFTVAVAFSDVKALGEEIGTWLLKEPLKYFETAFADAGQWLQGVASGAIVWTKGAMDDTGRVLKNAYRLTEQQTAHALRGAGYVASDVSGALKGAYNATEAVTAQALRGAGYAANDVGRALKVAYNVTADGAAQALRGAGYAANDVARALKGTFTNSANAAAGAMRLAGFGADQVGNALKGTFTSSARVAGEALKYAGYGATETARVMRNVYGASATAVAKFLKDVYRQGDKAVQAALKGAGYAAGQVNQAMKDVFNWFKKKFNPSNW